jgi:CRP-like cAMP-binding protein
MDNRVERTYKKGEVIYRQNDYETCLYDILYGSVALYQNYGTKDETLVKELNADSYFGEIELIEARPRTTTAVALEKTEVKVITAESFGAYF